MTTPEDSVAPTLETKAAVRALPVRKYSVVGIGASAGGLDALSEVLKRLPAKSGFAVLIVQHLDPTHESLLVELLARVSPMRVRWAEHGMSIEAGHVYVTPAHSALGVQKGVILLERMEGHGASRGIDHLFRSLAHEFGDRAIGVILSGTGSDGVDGLKAIKRVDGVTFAQSERTASFPEMPRAAIAAGCVDRVLAPAAIADELVRLTETSHVLEERLGLMDDEFPDGAEGEQVATVFRLLASRTGVDFAEYKQSTIKRRLVRRMMLAKTPELGEYVKLIQRNRDELDLLYESLLINVTDFFRDPEYYEFLQENILPAIIGQHLDGSPIRFWVAGCSTGEEAYSLAILLREALDHAGATTPVQIFGTDVSEQSVTVARAGVYSTGDVANISAERLNRFFLKVDRGFMIHKRVRDMCVFARQNVVKDSPFSRLDLVSCRNLLIYFNAKLQRKLMPLFHYALNPSGYLVLGTSESVGGNADLYRLIERRFRIYARKSSSHRANFEFPLDHHVAHVSATKRSLPPVLDPTSEPFDIIREADRILLSRVGPTGVLINQEMEIVQFRGDVTPFLSPVEGRASLNLMKMAREGLAAELQSIVQEARDKSVRVQRAGISIMQGNIARQISIDVTPIDAVYTKERFYLILFGSVETEQPPQETDSKIKAKKSIYLAQIDQLRQDLQATRSYLQTTIEKHEATNQELRAANEEIQSSNEELQSTNEELETAKEELQSTNEELTTVNEELHSRHLELIQVNNDLTNLINSVHLPILILAQDMRIRRFTPMAEKILNVIPTDIGRPLSDINTNLNIANLSQIMTEVMDTLTIKELEVQDNAGRWHSMRVRPYKTADNKIEGVVITLIDIDQMKRTISELEEARDFAQAVTENNREPVAVLNGEFRIKVANEAFYRLFRTTREYAQDRSFFETVQDNGKLGTLRHALEGILPTSERLTDFEVQMDLAGAGMTRLLVNAQQIGRGQQRTYPLILLSLRLPDQQRV
jgi:two-component system, chemotaxis family, CheB/CheR fusion protein